MNLRRSFGSFPELETTPPQVFLRILIVSVGFLTGVQLTAAVSVSEARARERLIDSHALSKQIWAVESGFIQFGNSPIDLHSHHDSRSALLYPADSVGTSVNTSTLYAQQTGWAPVAGSNLQTIQIGKRSHSGLVLAFLFGMSLVVLLGLLLLRSYHKAVETITLALKNVSRGHCDARIPAEANRWGLDKVIAKINVLLDHQQNLTRSLNHATAEIAHTLKRPLISLRQRLEHAREGTLRREHFAELIDESIAEIDSMVAMFEAILDIAQIEAGNFRSRFTEVDLKSVLLKLVDVYEAVIQDSGHKLIVNLNDDINGTSISGNFDLLFQMLNNLIENAIFYCPLGTTISVSLKGNKNELVITIADNGPGLSEEDRQKVFRPFFRPESTKTTPGHGLGIPFAAAIARLHRARIVLEDNSPGLKASLHFSRSEKPKKAHAMKVDTLSARALVSTRPPPVRLPAPDHPPKPRDGGYIHVENKEKGAQ